MHDTISYDHVSYDSHGLQLSALRERVSQDEVVSRRENEKNVSIHMEWKCATWN